MVYFVTSIHTDSGKTLVSAILTEALQADYWKPVQCGIEQTDLKTVKELVDNAHCMFFNERYLFKAPLSPHAAAQKEGVGIKLADFSLPANEGHDLIIEGAGGILVPLNDKEFVIDIAEKFQAEIILVSNIYLGSINHTLLTVNEMKRRGLKVKGIIFNGVENSATEEIILKHSGYKCLLRIRPEQKIDHETVMKYSVKLFEHWDD
ncbi:MAG TPA: dethiobiotin synthase [Cytophagaceae bacterium]|jgi:dethiobiotin synthetase|nr:dethiobiotin synthase [Cytophagaceae bacterium]